MSNVSKILNLKFSEWEPLLTFEDQHFNRIGPNSGKPSLGSLQFRLRPFPSLIEESSAQKDEDMMEKRSGKGSSEEAQSVGVQ